MADIPSYTSRPKSNNFKEVADNGLRDRLANRNTGTLSIKIKKVGNDEMMSKNGEHQRSDRCQHDLGRTVREPQPPLEMGPKRLKVKGPSFIGLDNRLD